MPAASRPDTGPSKVTSGAVIVDDCSRHKSRFRQGHVAGSRETPENADAKQAAVANRKSVSIGGAAGNAAGGPAGLIGAAVATQTVSASEEAQQEVVVSYKLYNKGLDYCVLPAGYEPADDFQTLKPIQFRQKAVETGAEIWQAFVDEWGAGLLVLWQ